MNLSIRIDALRLGGHTIRVVDRSEGKIAEKGLNEIARDVFVHRFVVDSMWKGGDGRLQGSIDFTVTLRASEAAHAMPRHATRRDASADCISRSTMADVQKSTSNLFHTYNFRRINLNWECRGKCGLGNTSAVAWVYFYFVSEVAIFQRKIHSQATKNVYEVKSF